MYSSTCSSAMSQLFSHSEIWSVCSIPCRFLLSFCLLAVQNTAFRQSDKYTGKDENSLVNNHQPLNALNFASVLVLRFRQVQISNTNAVRIVTEWWNGGSKLGNETMCILWSFPSMGTCHCRYIIDIPSEFLHYHTAYTCPEWCSNWTYWTSVIGHVSILSRMISLCQMLGASHAI